MSRIVGGLFGLFALVRAAFPDTCPDPALSSSNSTLGVCPQDFTIIGDPLEAVHEGIQAPTGLAVDPDLNIYLTYPRNFENSTNNVVICTSFTDEEPVCDLSYSVTLNFADQDNSGHPQRSRGANPVKMSPPAS